MDIEIKEKLLYLLRYMDDYIETLVYDVFNDSKEDPHYSAVTALNLIKCYIDVMDHFKVMLPFDDIKSYFDSNLFSLNEYYEFIEIANDEMQTYVGKKWYKLDKEDNQGTVSVKPKKQ